MTVKKRGMMSKDGHMDRMKMNSRPPLAGDVCPLLSLVGMLLKKQLLSCLVCGLGLSPLLHSLLVWCIIYLIEEGRSSSLLLFRVRVVLVMCVICVRWRDVKGWWSARVIFLEDSRLWERRVGSLACCFTKWWERDSWWEWKLTETQADFIER